MTHAKQDESPLTFTDLGLASPLIERLGSMSISVPTEVQRDTIPVALSGADLIAVAQTGSGKTLAYALPVIALLLRDPQARALVLSPSRETAEQIYRVFLQLAESSELSISFVATGVPVAAQAKELKKNPRLIVATPGRLNDHLTNNKLLLKGLQLLVVDEADRILDLGFEKQLRFIHGTLRGERQTLMFAATFGQGAESMAKLFMRPEAVRIRSGAAGAPVETLRQKAYFMMPGQKQNRLIDELRRLQGGVIIFAENKEGCVALGRTLDHHGFPSEFVHGDMNPGHRNRVLREFREEKIKIMVTTDLFARGLDVPSIRTVISYDLPSRGDEFLHRIGRTARAGRDGLAITFITPADGRAYRRLKPYLKGAEEEYLTDRFEFIDR